MVRKREIEQIAEAQNVPKSTIDKDWVLAEKLRALIQRSYAVSRDFYDICYLYKNQKSMDWSEIKSVFHEKMKFKNIEFKDTHQMLNDTTDKRVNPHCAERPNLGLKKNIFAKFQTILG